MNINTYRNEDWDQQITIDMTDREWEAFKKVMHAADDGLILRDTTMWDPIDKCTHEIILCTETALPNTFDIWASYRPEHDELLLDNTIKEYPGTMTGSMGLIRNWVLYPEMDQPWEEDDWSFALEHGWITQDDLDIFFACLAKWRIEFADMMDDANLPEQLWDKYGIPDVIDALLEWGNGSGEELFDHLTTKGLTPDEAHTVAMLLNKSCKK